MSTGKRLMICFIATAAAAVVFLAWIQMGFAVTGNELPLNDTKFLKSDIKYEEDKQTDRIVLPDDFEMQQTILFKTTHTKVRVLLDDEEIYSYGWEEDTPSFLKSPGTLWHTAEIPGNSGGKTLCVELYSVYENFYGNALEIRYGSSGACVFALLTDALVILVINCIILFAGLVSIILHIVTHSYKEENEAGSFLCVGFFSLAIAIWSLCQSGCLQMVIPDARVLYFVDFFSFYLFPIPFNLFVSTICRTKYKKGFWGFAGAYFVSLLFALAIQVSGWKDIFELITLTHMIMAVNVIYVFVAIRREVELQQNETARTLQKPLYIVMLFAAAELIAYYARGFRETSVFLPFGTIVFISMLIWLQVNRYYNKKLEEQKLEYYEKLANTDMLTEAWNRNAYEGMLKSMEQEEMRWNTTCVLMFDVNGMKDINDNYGHDKGDEALKLCYRCICQTFGPEGKCYRIGGDEFVYVSNQMDDLEALVTRFETAVSQISQGLEYPFSVAVGYARYDGLKKEQFRDVLRRSDTMMYENKRRHVEEAK